VLTAGIDGTAEIADAWCMNNESAEERRDSHEPVTPAAQQVSFFVRRGTDCLNQGELDRAIENFTEAIRIHPTNVQAIRRRGTTWYRKGEVDKAIVDYSLAVQIQPANALNYFFRGLAWHSQQEYENAISDYSEAIRLNPKNAQYYLNRSSAAFSGGDAHEALEDCDEAIRLDCACADAYRFRGRVLHRLREYDAAIEDFDEAIRIDPNDCRPYFRRALARAKVGEHHKAIADLDRVLAIEPRNTDAFVKRADVWMAEGAYAKAIADYTEAMRLDPNRAEMYRKRSAAFQEIDEHEKAQEDFDKATRLDGYESPGDQNMAERRTLVSTLIQTHFDPVSPDALSITDRTFPGRVRADLQLGIQRLFEGEMNVLHFCGVAKRYSQTTLDFSDLFVKHHDNPVVSIPPQYEEVDIGEEAAVLCLKTGIWLVEAHGGRFAVLLRPEELHGAAMVKLQVATTTDEIGTRILQDFFKGLEQSVSEARSYRGKVLSLDAPYLYSGQSSGITVHRLPNVNREHVILPSETLELLDRNLIQFVHRRPQLSKLGLPTKKGVLFYGPPGTGKTHTVRYLAAAIKENTTLVITAEQMGLLGEYVTLAKLMQPSTIVIEDVDLIARSRAQDSGGCGEVLLNRLLNEMDGLTEDADIIFILTTNRPEELEQALTSRPGRIDQAIEFPLPDKEGREKLIRLYSKGVDVPQDVVDATVSRTENVSGAFIKELMRRSAQFHLERSDSSTITLQDVNDALEELLHTGGSLNRKLLGAPFGTRTEP